MRLCDPCVLQCASSREMTGIHALVKGGHALHCSGHSAGAIRHEHVDSNRVQRLGHAMMLNVTHFYRSQSCLAWLVTEDINSRCSPIPFLSVCERMTIHVSHARRSRVVADAMLQCMLQYTANLIRSCKDGLHTNLNVKRSTSASVNPSADSSEASLLVPARPDLHERKLQLQKHASTISVATCGFAHLSGRCDRGL